MAEITRALIARVGVDLAKNVIQVHAVDGAGRRVVARAFKRDAFLAWCAQLPAGCVVAMETCSGAHHFARRLRAMGLDARLIAANFVSPYRMEGKGGKNDMTDAAAICEAASRPTMRFVPIKSCEQQGTLSLHRGREMFKEQRTACINQIRAVLAEAGLVFGKSPKVLRAVLAEVLEDASNELSGIARLVLQRAFEHWRELDEHLRWCDREVGQHVRNSPAAQRAAKIIGIGGGKASLGRITKRGDDYLRTLLIQGAKSAVMSAGKRDDATSRWLAALVLRVGWQKACVAMANKNARTLWAVMTRDKPFDAAHISHKPPAKCPGAHRPAAPSPSAQAMCPA